MSSAGLRSCVVLGTGPRAGQTLVAAAMVKLLCGRGLHAVGMKPIAHLLPIQGRMPRTTAELERLASVGAFGLPSQALCGRFVVSGVGEGEADPQHACALDDAVDTFRTLATWADTVVVDASVEVHGHGVSHDTTLKMAHELQLPFVLVIAWEPGCVEKALQAARSLQERDLVCAAWVVNHYCAGLPVESAAWSRLKRDLPGVCMGRLPRVESASVKFATQALDVDRLQHALAPALTTG